MERFVSQKGGGYNKVVLYKYKRITISTHGSGRCLIDYGQELRFIDRQTAARVIRYMRAGKMEKSDYGLGWL